MEMFHDRNSHLNSKCAGIPKYFKNYGIYMVTGYTLILFLKIYKFSKSSNLQTLYPFFISVQSLFRITCKSPLILIANMKYQQLLIYFIQLNVVSTCTSLQGYRQFTYIKIQIIFESSFSATVKQSHNFSLQLSYQNLDGVKYLHRSRLLTYTIHVQYTLIVSMPER